MPKNLIIDGKTLEGVTALKATDADSGTLVLFPDTSDATASAEDINAGKSAYVDGVKVNGTNTGTIPNDLDGIVDGTITSFTMPSGKTVIKQYRFYKFTSLTSANLGGATIVELHAFDGCTNLANVSLVKLTEIGTYAFRSLGSGQSATFVFTPEEECLVDGFAFISSRVSKVTGKFSSIGIQAFTSCTSLTEIDIECPNIGSRAFYEDSAVATIKAKVNGAIGEYAFYGLTAVSDCDFDKENIVTSLGKYAFSRFASNRASASSNIISLDFRKSTFTSIPQYAFGGDRYESSLQNKYMKIMLPSSVREISSYAFRYTKYSDFYFGSETPPTLSDHTAWESASYRKIFVPYNSANAYRTATNWAAQSAYIRGYVAENTLEIGATLPPLSVEGYGLTWYKDPACTIPATIVEDEDSVYYCVVGTEKGPMV